MSQHLPLVAAQPGIWMAEKLSDLPSAWSVRRRSNCQKLSTCEPTLIRTVLRGH